MRYTLRAAHGECRMTPFGCKSPGGLAQRGGRRPEPGDPILDGARLRPRDLHPNGCDRLPRISARGLHSAPAWFRWMPAPHGPDILDAGALRPFIAAPCVPPELFGGMHDGWGRCGAGAPHGSRGRPGVRRHSRRGACVRGTCRACDPESTEGCEGFCVADEECESPLECHAASCREGHCFYTPDDALCLDADTVCAPGVGCVMEAPDAT